MSNPVIILFRYAHEWMDHKSRWLLNTGLSKNQVDNSRCYCYSSVEYEIVCDLLSKKWRW